jgi:hypothetical protein
VSEFCRGCPVNEKIKLYKRAGSSPQLAEQIASDQQILENQPQEVKMDHFRRHVETLVEVGCKTGYLCAKNGRPPQYPKIDPV